MAELNKEFVVDLRGNQFVTYNGLVDLAHQMKLKSITTEIIQLPSKENGNQCIMKAVATTEDGKVFEGYGDADPSNVNSMIARHLIRMAETRSKARALRDLTNVGMTAIEELGGEDEEKTPKANKPKPKKIKTNKNMATKEEFERLYALVKEKEYASSIAAYIEKAYNKKSSTELNKKEVLELIEMLEGINSPNYEAIEYEVKKGQNPNS